MLTIGTKFCNMKNRKTKFLKIKIHKLNSKFLKIKHTYYIFEHNFECVYAFYLSHRKNKPYYCGATKSICGWGGFRSRLWPLENWCALNSADQKDYDHAMWLCVLFLFVAWLCLLDFWGICGILSSSFLSLSSIWMNDSFIAIYIYIYITMDPPTSSHILEHQLLNLSELKV